MLSYFKKKKTTSTRQVKPEPRALPVAEKEPDVLKPIKVPVSFLKRLFPISQLLSEDELTKLPIKSASYSPGSILFNQGSEVNASAYIVKGSVFLEASNGSGLEITAGTMKALYPLSTGPFHHLTAIAKTNATVIYLPYSALESSQPERNPLKYKYLLDERLQTNTFFNRFYKHYQTEELNIPNVPDITIKLRKTIGQDVGIAEVVKIINLDPVIAAKLIQIVNSPLYRTVNPITNCHDAVNRLGLNTTRNLVTAIGLKNLIKSEKPAIKKLIQETWLQSVKISGISHTLARLTGKIDPEEALLAGLLYNIGTLPLLMFADSLSDENYTRTDLELCINELQGPLGMIILEQWDFPDNFRKIPLQTSHWFEHTGADLSLADIVVLAKFHHYLGGTQRTELPLISTLPAFQKLHNQLLTPDMSLQILQDSKEQIQETMNFFAS